MKIAPFRIQKLTFDAAKMRVKTDAVNGRGDRIHPERSADDFPAYLVTSTAPHNIDEIDAPPEDSVAQTQKGLMAIACTLHRIQNDPTIAEPPELVVAVHGYNTEEEGIRAWYSDIYRYIAQDDRQIRQRRNLVFIGYRWSSERLSLRPRHLWRNLRALPEVPQGVLASGLALVLLYWSWAGFGRPMGRAGFAYNLLIEGGLSGAIALTVMILTLLILRLSVYFRDVYRAINFGVPDLTELLRQIDQAVIDLRNEEIKHTSASYSEAIRRATQSYDESLPRIQLSFLGHSMGALVVTNVVRILSDVFDRGSIAHNPTPKIGDTLSLGRLILASPDIPVLSIISSRANGLASSLRRFSEAYLFSNEGDLALRLASTAVNYISFPSAKQHYGHRLGSIALTNDVYKKGVVNLPSLQRYYSLEKDLGEAITTDPEDILDALFITHSSGSGDGYLSLADLFDIEHRAKSPATLADLFTFFDCTDYKDYRLTLGANGWRDRSAQKTGLLTRAKHRQHLNTWDYIELLFDTVTGRRDVHGGYFKGEYSRQLIYRIAFLGFEGTLQAIATEISLETISADLISSEQALEAFNGRCMEKGIEVYLSPLRYRVDVQGADLAAAREEMLQTVRAAQQPDEVSENTHKGATTRQSVSVAG